LGPCDRYETDRNDKMREEACFHKDTGFKNGTQPQACCYSDACPRIIDFPRPVD
jgi:hypothetical protein